MGFLWWALPVQLAEAGVGAGDVARLLSLLVLPWGLKLFWAPLVDVARGPRFTTRHWILCAQLAMALTLLPLLWLDPVADLGWVTVTLMLHAVAASTQDGAIDGLAISSVPPAERGAVNGWMQVGMLSSRALFGGGALLVSQALGQGALVLALIVLLVGSALLLTRVRLDTRPPPDPAGPAARLGRLARAIGRGLRRSDTWAGLALVLVAGAGFKSLTALAGPLLVERGADRASLGIFFGVVAVVAMATGSLLGGRLADSWRRLPAVALGEGLAALLVLAVGLVVLRNPGPGALVILQVLLGLLYVAIGIATAALYALCMDLTEPSVAVTQFSLFMAGINLCEAWSTAVLGLAVEAWGYGPAICAMALPSLAVLVVLRGMGGAGREHSRA